jgi:hypothetical protein
MKTIFKPSILVLLAVVMLASCSKKDSVKPTTSTGISLVAGNWATTEWGVTNNTLIFTIDKTTAKGTVDAISNNGFGFVVGDTIFSEIRANSDGTYSCSASYSATGSGPLSVRNATMSLQNNNTQLTVYYPALNSSFPAITYVFQQSNTTVINL